MTTSPTERTLARRTVLRGAAGAATVGLGLNAASTAAAQDASEPAFGGWFDNTSNFDGIVDRTGKQKVTITVGAAGNNGNYAFGPAAVQVDPGTTVTWKWSGKGSLHNVVAEDGSFESETTDEKGHTFEQTFEKTGVVKYACTPHKPMGMKGAVVVGDAAPADTSSDASAGESASVDYDGWFDDTSNFDGTVDETGAQEVTVTVGTEGNNGNFAFDPPAVRVEPGTTVVWEWSGKGGVHDVVAEDGSFESETTDEKGHTFTQTFDESGVVKYACSPHKPMGMKGAVVVGDASTGGGTAGGSSDSGLPALLAIGGGVGLVGALFGLFAAGARSETRREHPAVDR